MASQNKDFLKSFEFHGLVFNKDGVQPVTTCPLCGKENHFFVNADTGQWDCKVCGQAGNLYTFLARLHETIKETYKKKQGAGISALSKHRRGIPVKAFKDYDIAFDGHRYYLPIVNGDGSLANLKVYDGPGTPLMGTTYCSHHLLNASLVSSNPKATLYLTEGEWDCIALDWLKDRVKKPAVILGLPGANVFKDDWVELLRDRNVVLLFDNDKAGQQAQDRLLNRLHHVAKSLRYIQWPGSIKEGYDVNDFVAERVSAPGDAWQELHSMLVSPKPFTEQERAKLGKVTFERLLKEYKRFFYVDKRMKDSLAVCLATTISIQLPADPLWVFLVGPPGSGKTLMLSSFRHSDRCEYLSSISPKSLVSGWKTEDGSDPSLLARLPGRTLVLKDYTELMTMPLAAQEEIYGVLRNAYDGEYAKTFGHGTNRSYHNCFFSLVAGVTHAIKGDNRAGLGERFLRFSLIDNTHNVKAHIERALDSFLNADFSPRAAKFSGKKDKGGNKQKDKQVKKPTTVADELRIQELTTAFVDQAVMFRPNISQTYKTKLRLLAELVSALRTRVEKTITKDPKYRPEREVGSRLVRQLAKLAQALTIVFDLKSMNEDVYRIVKICALDTVAGYHLDALRPLLLNPSQEFTAEDVALDMDVSSGYARACLIDLLQLNLIERHRIDPTGRGNPKFVYQAKTEIVQAYKTTGLDQTLRECARPAQAKLNRPKRPKKSKTTKPKRKTTPPRP